MVIGFGAAGLMCASEAGKRGRKLLDHHVSWVKNSDFWGGRCNFTNLYTAPEAFCQIRISVNRRFVNMTSMISSRWLISDHEKKLGVIL